MSKHAIFWKHNTDSILTLEKMAGGSKNEFKIYEKFLKVQTLPLRMKKKNL